MKKLQAPIGRRTFLRAAAFAGGGLIINFSWLNGLARSGNPLKSIAGETIAMNGYLKIAADGIVTIMSPNPEGGQNVKTTMPMIVAEELDVDWKSVVIEQAPLNTQLYNRQFIGGSQAIRSSWKTLRNAGATARLMLLQAAAQTWTVSVQELTTDNGIIFHRKSGRSVEYGKMAALAATLPLPKEVKLKKKQDFRIIGTSPKNVDGAAIVSGKPLYGIDIRRKGMMHAMIVHPPGFGLKFKSFDDSVARKMPGIKDVFVVKVFNDGYVRQFFDTCTFMEVVAIVGDNTWNVMNAKKALKIEWIPFDKYEIERTAFGAQQPQKVTVPSGLESADDHNKAMIEMMANPASPVRKDGDPETAFKNAARVIERTYTAPFLAHNCMEPMNFFADVTEDKAELEGPLQKPELTEQALSARLGIPVDRINIQMTRLGGGFGRRSYAHWLIEAALISQKIKAPVKLLYSREDDMTSGIYRPAYMARYRAALDADNNLIGFHVRAGGIPENPLAANSFPAGAVENYLAESWTVNSNITTGSFRAPKSNFIASAEQSFLDEVAEAVGKDPFDFRLQLLGRAIENPVGKNNDYDAARYAAVLNLLREKSEWDRNKPGISKGIAMYYCHNTYAGQVLELKLENGKPVIPKVCCAIDCGIVINPGAARNLTEGSIVDGIGNALYGSITFSKGVPDRNNFNAYRMIRHSEAPKSIDVHFVENDIDPTGMGEPAFPPVFAALANALYKATGKRFYDQPYIKQITSEKPG